MTKAELAHYANSQGVRLDLADICNTIEEVDAAKKADEIMKTYTSTYYMVKELAPHNPTRHKGRFRQLYDAAKNEGEEELLVSEWRSLSPLSSEVIPVKAEALDVAIGILKDANIGKNRIEKMIPLLTDTLMDDENLPTEIPIPPNFLK